MDQQLLMIKGLSIQELNLITQLMADMKETEKQSYLAIYMGRRRERSLMMLLTILGFFLVAGLQRFVINHIAMGILYFLTGGLCFVGTIIDLVNIDRLTDEYNQKVALETKQLLLASRSVTPSYV